MVGRSLIDLVAPEDRERLTVAVAQASESRIPVCIQATMASAGGSAPGDGRALPEQCAHQVLMGIVRRRMIVTAATRRPERASFGGKTHWALSPGLDSAPQPVFPALILASELISGVASRSVAELSQIGLRPPDGFQRHTQRTSSSKCQR